MPGKHAATQAPRAPRSLARTAGARRATPGSAVSAVSDGGDTPRRYAGARSTSWAALGLTGALALSLGGAAVGDDGVTGVGDLRLLPATGSAETAGLLVSPLQRVSQTVETLVARHRAEGAGDAAPAAYVPRHRAATAAEGGRQTSSQGPVAAPAGGGTDAGGDSGTAPGPTRAAVDTAVGTVAGVADRAPAAAQPVLDPVVDGAGGALGSTADTVDGLLPLP